MKPMNSIFAIYLSTAFFCFYSCENMEPVDKEPNKINLTRISTEILEAEDQFAFELFREVCSLSDQENIMISPLSVSCALGMTFNGAAGTTLDAFYDVLHFGELTTTEVNESYKDLMSQLVHLDDNVEFSIANSIWYRIGLDVLAGFIATNQEYFDAAVEELDFSDPGAVETINHWIEQKTNDKIQDMLDVIPPNAVMYLINAIYFNATWKYRFDKEATYTGDFILEGGTLKRTDFMKVQGNFNYTLKEDFRAVELPYGDSAFSMVVLLPADGVTADELAEMMDAGSWDSWFAQSYMENLQIELPKFRYGFKMLLNDPLISQGLGIAFSSDADFSGITPGGGIFISRVIHQAFIDVQEEGTEAAAATIVEMTRSSSGGPSVFRVDKPFLYVIRENSTSTIIFMGKVGMPEYS